MWTTNRRGPECMHVAVWSSGSWSTTFQRTRVPMCVTGSPGFRCASMRNRAKFIHPRAAAPRPQRYVRMGAINTLMTQSCTPRSWGSCRNAGARSHLLTKRRTSSSLPKVRRQRNSAETAGLSSAVVSNNRILILDRGPIPLWPTRPKVDAHQ